LAFEMINDFLPAAAMPPFDGVIVFAAGADNPIRLQLAKRRFDRTGLRLLVIAQMNVALEFRGPDSKAELIVEVFDKAMDKMVGSSVALVDERVVTNDGANVGIFLFQRR